MFFSWFSILWIIRKQEDLKAENIGKTFCSNRMSREAKKSFTFINFSSLVELNDNPWLTCQEVI